MPVGADREEQEEWQVGGLRAGNKDRMDGPHGPSGDNVRDVRVCLLFFQWCARTRRYVGSWLREMEV